LVSVDDLVISLRIDESSNLGKLQKQLKALVGDKGQKAVGLGLGIDPDLKRDISYIKAELSFISAQTVPDIKNVQELQESLHRDRKTLERSFDAATQRLVSQNTTAFQAQLEEYGVDDEAELIEQLSETVQNFIGMMKLGETGKLPGKIMQKIDFAAKMLIASEKLADGDRKGLINRMEKAIGELNVMFSKVLTKAGIQHKAEFNLYQIRRSWYKKQELDSKEMKLDMDALIGTDEDVIKAYDKIKDFIGVEGGMTKFLISALTKLGITPTPEMFTKEAIKKSPELQAVAQGVLQEAWGTKAGIPTGFHSYLRDLLEKTQGLNVKDIYENARPDFLLLNNKLEDLEKIFPPEIAKTLSQLISYIELKSILTESNKEQFKKYTDMIGDEFLVGVAAVVKSSFKDYFPKIGTAMINIVRLLQKFAPESFMTPEQLKELSEERIQERVQEMEDMAALIEDMEELSGGGEKGGLGINVPEGYKEDTLEDMKDQLEEIKKTGESTNAEVKKIDTDPKREEEE